MFLLHSLWERGGGVLHGEGAAGQWQWCGRGKRVASGQEKAVDSWEGWRGKKIKEEKRKVGMGLAKVRSLICWLTSEKDSWGQNCEVTGILLGSCMGTERTGVEGRQGWNPGVQFGVLIVDDGNASYKMKRSAKRARFLQLLRYWSFFHR